MATHIMAIFVCATGITLFVIIGLVAKPVGWGRSFELGAGVISTCLLAIKYIFYNLPASGLELFLPLHLCNLAEILACLSLLTRWYWFRSVLYFWSLAAVIVFITPEPPDVPGTLPYSMFWFSHALILGVAAYDLIVAGFRPRLKDLRVVILVSLCYMAIVLPIDIIWEKNYGYLGPVQPSVATLIDYLGSWPLRVLWIVLIGMFVFVLAWAPWAIFYQRKVRT